jgi:hypothetical protein
VKVNDKPVCESNVLYGGEGLFGQDGKRGSGTIQGTSACDTPIKVFKGDNMTIVAHYDLEAHPS